MKNDKNVINTKTEERTINTTVKITREIFYNPESMFGIYAVEPTEKNELLSYNSYGNVSVQGVVGKLRTNKTYDLLLSPPVPNKNPKYADYHLIKEIVIPALDTSKKQFDFLQMIVTEQQYESFHKSYPNTMIIDLIENDQIDVSKVKYVKEKKLKEIKLKIEEQRGASVLMAELVDLDLTSQRIRTIISHYGSVSIAVQRVRESIYNLCSIRGFGFLTVDGYALKRGEKTDSPYRINAAVKYFLEKESSAGHTWTDIDTTIVELGKLTSLDSDTLLTHFSSENQSIKIIDGKVTTDKLYNDEFYVYKNLMRIKSNYTPPSDLASKMEEGINHAEMILGVKYTEEQRKAIINSFKEGVYILNGGGGVGKTTVLKGIISIYEFLGKTYSGCALSGKAANIMQQNGIEASTIHRLLGLGMDSNKDNTEDDGFEFLNQDLIILDEASMTNASLFNILTSRIKTGGLFIIVGDSGQLSGIGHGDILRDLLSTNEFNKTILTQIHRQAADSGIIELAYSFRNSKQVTHFNEEAQSAYGVNKDMMLFTSKDKNQILANVKEAIKAFKPNVKSSNDLLEFQILTARKEGDGLTQRTLNKFAQELFNPMNNEYTVSSNGYVFKIGDKVIANTNNYDIEIVQSIEDIKKSTKLKNPKVTVGNSIIEAINEYKIDQGIIEDIDGNEIAIETKEALYNGTMGIIEFIDVQNEDVYIKFENMDGYVVLSFKDLDGIDMAYAITVHKSQGSSIPNVIGAFDMSSFMLLSKQLVYTLVTRSSNRCVLMCENSSLHKAIKTDSSGQRRTFLADIINVPEKYSELENVEI